uniref:Putative trypsin-like peptidase domain containing protein n=1 Tax=viral metagenome TaxID=1070528 RepID=A0A6H1ZTH1_9ZZZZ
MKAKVFVLIAIVAALFIGVACTINIGISDEDVKKAARRASVQTSFHIPVMKAFFTTPLAEKEEITRAKLNEAGEKRMKEIDEKIKQAIEEERKKQAEDKYESFLTEINEWGYLPVSKSMIPLGTFAPAYAKFPERILVGTTTEKKEIKEWEKEYEKDVLSVSETANVSPTKAREIISRLRASGYSINKEEISQSSDVKLLWFRAGWDSEYPTELDWKVEVEGTETNIITGYDPRGILIVRWVPDKKRVYVKAGYFDLKTEYREKPDEVKKLEEEIRGLKEEKEKLKKDLEEKQSQLDQAKDVPKRDIGTATWADVQYGTVKLERFWILAQASGIFLGNMRVLKEQRGWMPYRAWGNYEQTINSEMKGVVLTNAHVASYAKMFEIWISKDKEIMWILFPGVPYVRMTKDSDHYGSPAEILSIDQVPVMSMDVDAAIMVTSPIPQYEPHKAVLGNSDKVKEGDPVIMVGNPSGFQKFLTQGVVSNTKYSVLDTLNSARWFKYLKLKERFNWLKNSNFWFDTPIGVGGTSGSGVWALKGSEKGKVVAIHNMGLVQQQSSIASSKDDTEWNPKEFTGYGKLSDVARHQFQAFFADYPYQKASYRYSQEEFEKENDTFSEMMQAHSYSISGMNAGIPINYVKRFLQERGLDPDHFGWGPLKEKYWEK